MVGLNELKESFLHILFPHVCSGCGSDLVNKESMLCLRCMSDLPGTDFHLHAGNPVEKIFWGRLPFAQATAQYYFTKGSLMQELMHQLKYKGNRELGWQLGRLVGEQILQSNRFDDIDALIPLPLFPAREKKRGYNQATVLCEGMSQVLKIEILKNVVSRVQQTETQTKKARVERWQNMEGKFLVKNPEKLQSKHVLLVDDVVTTGATLEACGHEILKVEKTQLSLATLCFASR